MKKLFLILMFCAGISVSAQSQYTAAQVEKSTDAKVIANFIKYNPAHPRTPEFRQKLMAVINNDRPAAAQASLAKPSIKPISTSKLEKAVNRDIEKHGTNEKHKRTADLLNHLFNTDPSSRTAYIQLVNKSKCNLIVKISGKNFYNLDVPANNQNFILVDKGNYTITTMVCDAKYSSVKNINKDIVLTLNSPK